MYKINQMPKIFKNKIKRIRKKINNLLKIMQIKYKENKVNQLYHNINKKIKMLIYIKLHKLFKLKNKNKF